MPDPSLSAVSGALVAECCGISRRQHSNLVRAGVMPKPEGHRYDLAASVRAFIAYRSGGDGTLAAEKLRLTAARREKLELENARRRGELVLAWQVQEEWMQHAALLIGLLQALPGRAASLGAMKDAAELRQILLEEVRAIRQSIADAMEARIAAHEHRAEEAGEEGEECAACADQ